MSLKTTIEGLSRGQVKAFNRACVCKINNQAEESITQSEQDEVNDLVSDIDNLSVTELESLNSSLSANRKLGGRPC